MTADQFLDSLKPLLAAGPRGRALALDEIDDFISACRYYDDNPGIGPLELERLQVARKRIEAGRVP